MQGKLRPPDTIAAIATPPGIGAISVIRVSGNQAVDLVGHIFHGNAKLADVPGNTIHYGMMTEQGGQCIDQVLVSVFREPHSYTGEDLIEIGCHGGEIVPGKVLAMVLAAGARQADPGEFTRRAFLNGKVDLSQAEAVSELISSRSLRHQELSLSHLRGRLGTRIREIREEILRLCSILEIDLDFSEEGIDLVTRDQIEESLGKATDGIDALAESYRLGRILRDGVRVAIVGPPNVGKSSLFNALLADDRSIVSPTPGTTRDYIEEPISISGVLFSLVDTAGARNATDDIEAEGVRRADDLSGASDITLAVVDSSNPGQFPFWDMWIAGRDPVRVLVAFNKSDVSSHSTPGAVPFIDQEWRKVPVSALTGGGLTQLREALLERALGTMDSTESGVVVTSRRVADALSRARGSLGRALDTVRVGGTSELVAVDVREAITSISEVTGEVTSDEILDSIFSQFCIGK